MSLPLVITELVEAKKCPIMMTVAPINIARVLRDAMAISMSNKVTPADESLSAPSIVAGMAFGIDIGRWRCQPSGNGKSHQRSRDYAGSMSR